MIARRGSTIVFRREQNLAPRIIPFPPGRTMFADYPGISCLATFI